ncbi:MAG: aldo/keto reductase, partial [Phycisphaerae bacterium]
GVRLIDSAACYEGSEELIGEAIGHRREEFTLVTKCGHHEILPDGSMRSRPISMSDVEDALGRLGTDVIDVMLLHSYDRDLLEAGDAVGVLAAAKQAGKIRAAGYSGDNQTAVTAMGMEDLTVLETSVSLADQANIELAVAAARAKGAGVIAKRPLANAVWRWLGDPQACPSHPREYLRRLSAMATAPASVGFDGDWAELALRFPLSVPGVHTAIAGSISADHWHANIAAADRGPLPQEVYRAVRSAFDRARGNADWPGEN